MEKELFIIVIAIIERHGCACERTMFAVIAVKWCMFDAWTGRSDGGDDRCERRNVVPESFSGRELVGGSGGIRAGSDGDPEGIRVEKGGIRQHRGGKNTSVVRDPPAPNPAFIILKRVLLAFPGALRGPRGEAWGGCLEFYQGPAFHPRFAPWALKP